MFCVLENIWSSPISVDPPDSDQEQCVPGTPTPSPVHQNFRFDYINKYIYFYRHVHQIFSDAFDIDSPVDEMKEMKYFFLFRHIFDHSKREATTKIDSILPCLDLQIHG